jgi:DHA3 family macrolide efflux protein-like MFS transporter
VMSTWGGTKRKINGVLIGMMLIGLSQGVIGLGQALLIWAAGNFLVAFILPILNGSNQAIWQAKVAPDVQGRVFATRRLIAQITAPIAMIMAGPLADKLFGPAMLSSGALAPIFGNLLGTGPGAGMSLMFMFSGIGGFLIGLSGYAIPAVRDVEVILPDFDALPAAPNPEKLLREKQMQELLAARQRLLGLPDSQHRKNELRSISRNLRALGQQPVEE